MTIRGGRRGVREQGWGAHTLLKGESSHLKNGDISMGETNRLLRVKEKKGKSKNWKMNCW